MFALEGIRVLDLSRYAPGHFVTMMLGDMGADVIRIDEPPPPDQRDAEAQAAVHSIFGLNRADPAYALNRNKQSIILNLKSHLGRAIFLRMSDAADVVLEGFRPGVVARLGVDYETLSARNPRLVYCSLSGYGQSGPYSRQSGHDINYISRGGALSLTGPGSGSPIPPGFLLADMAGGAMFSLAGILLALLTRERTGRGQYVDVAMADGVVQLLAAEFSAYFARNSAPDRATYWASGAAPWYSVYRCSDGRHLSIGALERPFWDNLCRALGLERYIECQHEKCRWPEMRAALQEVFASRPRDDWVAALSNRDVCIAPVYSLDEVVNDPQTRHRQMFVDVPTQGTGGTATNIPQAGFAIKLSETPASIRSPAPRPGQHTDSLLESLGYSAEEIAGLRDAGAVY